MSGERQTIQRMSENEKKRCFSLRNSTWFAICSTCESLNTTDRLISITQSLHHLHQYCLHSCKCMDCVCSFFWYMFHNSKHISRSTQIQSIHSHQKNVFYNKKDLTFARNHSSFELLLLLLLVLFDVPCDSYPMQCNATNVSFISLFLSYSHNIAFLSFSCFNSLMQTKPSNCKQKFSIQKKANERNSYWSQI